MADPHPPVDDRSALARGIAKASHVTSIAITMVVPILPGYWLDTYLRTIPLFTVLGLAFGMTAGIWQLIRLVNKTGSVSANSDRRRRVEQGDDDHVENNE